METIANGLARNEDGRPILSGCETLPPMEAEPGLSSMRNSKAKPKGRTKGKPNAKRKTADRFGVLNQFVDCSLDGLTRSELATWLVLYRDTRNGTAATGQTDIARRAGLSVRAVKTAVHGLKKRGLLTVIYTGGLSRGPSRYRVESVAKK